MPAAKTLLPPLTKAPCGASGEAAVTRILGWASLPEVQTEVEADIGLRDGQPHPLAPALGPGELRASRVGQIRRTLPLSSS